jgi:hypothetical protein
MPRNLIPIDIVHNRAVTADRQTSESQSLGYGTYRSWWSRCDEDDTDLRILGGIKCMVHPVRDCAVSAQ